STSSDGLDTAAVLTTSGYAPGPTSTRTVTVALSPTSSGPSSTHVTVAPSASHERPAYVSPSGRSSVTVIGPGADVGPWFVTTSSYVARSPTTSEPASDLAIARSTCAGTSTVVVVRSSSRTGSCVDVLTSATLSTAGYADGSTVVVTVTAGASVRGGRGSSSSQRTSASVTSHTQPSPAAAVATRPRGRVSTTTTSRAGDGPPLRTRRVNVRSSPTRTGPVCVFVTDTFAWCSTSTVSVSSSSLGSGSVVGESTRAT